ncbi:MAG: papain-like cysteine protease family protein [Chloroflexota bacterium]
MPISARNRERRNRLITLFLVLLLLGTAAIATNVLGAGDRLADLVAKVELIVHPPPDRPIDDVTLITPMPEATAEPTPAPGATATAKPVRKAVDINLYTDPAKHFISETDHTWCAVAGTQMVLAAHGQAPLTEKFQATLAHRIGEWESRRDSHNGGWGPSAIIKALDAYGVTGYELRAYETRQDALADAARAIETTHAPVLLMAWRGAHTWVMTGFTADADPLLFDTVKVTGAYILDPWYPRVSSIWGPSDPPGTFQDPAEMKRNYLPWDRPEGVYASRDGLFLAVVPTVAISQP